MDSFTETPVPCHNMRHTRREMNERLTKDGDLREGLRGGDVEEKFNPPLLHRKCCSSQAAVSLFTTTTPLFQEEGGPIRSSDQGLRVQMAAMPSTFRGRKYASLISAFSSFFGKICFAYLDHYLLMTLLLFKSTGGMLVKIWKIVRLNHQTVPFF